MTTDRPVIHVSTLAFTLASLVLSLGLLTLAVIDVGLAIVVIIFAFIFGGNLLGHITTALADEVTSSVDETKPNDTAADSLETLRARYASGDLSDAEFERRLETLVETETETDAARYLADQSRQDDRGRPPFDSAAERDGGTAREDGVDATRDRDPDPERSIE
ncbi:SHOCT domain-containing protein [Natrialba taiwanensis]|uniref:SHOCT domain-containing protein n=1 Tax=Natrialba taiwanensis DSM 12281 TaxID=1230458 RepID=L9ZTL4_9EURY|nr:SHOCT domain-containing protein [Natrialba taiwanensis]ELY88897.1 hypothetical protein C484_14928 [Natrialba taiwanensis DSM 12281]